MKQAAQKRNKPTTKLELVLLPPKEKKVVTDEDVKIFYKRLTMILMSEF